MKKLTTLFFALIVAHCSWAYSDFTAGGIYYAITSDSTVEITYKDPSIPTPEYTGSITIPSTVAYSSVTYNVTSIGRYAFRGCSGLTSITIPSSVTSIGYNAFFGTAWYDSQPDGLVYAGNVAYKYKGTMPANTSITINNGTVGIVDYAFSSCTGLTSVTIPPSVTSIGAGVFYGCTGLTSVTIPSSVTSIRYNTFYGCSGLTSVTIPSSVTSIGEYAFSGTAWYNNQPDGLVYAGNVVYKYKGAMPANTSIVLNSSTTGIADYAFFNCTNLISLIILNIDANIGYYNTQGVVMMNIRKIISNADILNNQRDTESDGEGNLYSYAENLDTVILLSDTLKENGFKALAYSNSSLRYLDLDATANTEMADEALYNFYNMETLLLPNNLQKIGYRQIADCMELDSITIPATVTEIGKRGFENCRSMKKVTFEAGSQLTVIDKWAFYACHALDSITIPAGVTSIGDGAFWGCDYMQSVSIPASVIAIGDNGFDGCQAMSVIKCDALQPPTILGGLTFNEIDKSIPVLVPTGTVDLYKAAYGWQDFYNITDNTNGINTSSNKDLKIYAAGANVMVMNAGANAISVYNVSGQKVSEVTHPASTQAISVPQAGVYVVRVGGEIRKVITSHP